MLKLSYVVNTIGLYLFHVTGIAGAILSLGERSELTLGFLILLAISIGFNLYNWKTKNRTFHYHYYAKNYDGVTFKRNRRDAKIMRLSWLGMVICILLLLVGLIPILVMFFEKEPEEYIKAALGSMLILMWCISQFYYCIKVLQSIKNRK